MNNIQVLLRVAMLAGLLLLLVSCSQAVQAPGSATPTVYSWQTLQQRPLHLPALKPGALCPTTYGHRIIPELGFLLGNGPVYADFFGSGPNGNELGVLHYADAQSFAGGRSHWGGEKVIFFINPTYRGPALIRGRQLDGPGMIRFNGTDDPPLIPDQALLTELRLTADVGGDPWPSGGSYTRLQAPGCYAYQVDGPAFSYAIIFKAIAVHISFPKT
jgi:hypothetical protein